MNTTHAPETITVARRMYLVPRDATIPGGMTYRHSGALRTHAEFVADDCGLSPDERAKGIDFYTYEKLESPGPRLTIQGGLVLGNVRFAHENPDEARPVVMFLDRVNVAVVWPDGDIEYEELTPDNYDPNRDNYDPNRSDMIFDVIFDPEHATAATSEENTKVTITDEKLESPEQGLVVQGGLVLGNVRFDHESPDETRHIVMFLDGGKVAVAYPDGEASVSHYMHWNDFDPNRNEMVFDVIFDPEHDIATTSEESTK